MDIQIIGLVLLSVTLICATIWGVSMKKEKHRDERQKRAQRYAHNEKLASDSSFALYQQTAAELSQAQTKIRIQGEQIKRRDKEIERLKKLLEGVSYSPFDKEVKA